MGLSISSRSIAALKEVPFRLKKIETGLFANEVQYHISGFWVQVLTDAFLYAILAKENDKRRGGPFQGYYQLFKKY